MAARTEWLTFRADPREIALADAAAATANQSRSEIIRRGLRKYAAEVLATDLGAEPEPAADR